MRRRIAGGGADRTRKRARASGSPRPAIQQLRHRSSYAHPTCRPVAQARSWTRTAEIERPAARPRTRCARNITLTSVAGAYRRRCPTRWTCRSTWAASSRDHAGRRSRVVHLNGPAGETLPSARSPRSVQVPSPRRWTCTIDGAGHRSQWPFNLVAGGAVRRSTPNRRRARHRAGRVPARRRAHHAGRRRRRMRALPAQQARGRGAGGRRRDRGRRAHHRHLWSAMARASAPSRAVESTGEAHPATTATRTLAGHHCTTPRRPPGCHHQRAAGAHRRPTGR